MSESEPEYELTLELTSDDPAYTHGFEMGKLWEQLKPQPATVSGTYHAVNGEQMRVMARRLGYRVELTPLDDYWVGADFRALE